jgi:RND superfamily putative drug exporter
MHRVSIVLVTNLALVVAGATWGAGGGGALTGGGYDDPNSQSNRAAAGIAAALGQREPDLIVLWSSDTLVVTDPAFNASVDGFAALLRFR